MAGEYQSVGRMVEQLNFMLTNSQTVSAVLRRQFIFALDLAQRALVSSVSHRNFITEATLNLVEGQEDYTLPLDFRRIMEPSPELTGDDGNQLTWYDEAERVLGQWDYGGVQAGRPYKYSVPTVGAGSALGKLRVWPIPDQSYTLAYRYLAHPIPLVPSGDPDDVSDDQPLDPRIPRDGIDGVLHGAVMRFPQYLTGEQLQVYVSLYQKAVRAMHGSTMVEGQTVQRPVLSLGTFRNSSGTNLAWPSLLGG